MVTKRIYNLGSRNATKYVELPQCFNCGKDLGMRPDWKEIKGKKYCNSCANKFGA